MNQSSQGTKAATALIQIKNGIMVRKLLNLPYLTYQLPSNTIDQAVVFSPLENVSHDKPWDIQHAYEASECRSSKNMDLSVIYMLMIHSCMLYLL